MAESIQVFYTKIGNPVGNITYYHKYLVYTDSSGNQYGARGGPSVNGGLGALTPAQSGSSGSQSSSGSPFGDIETQVRPFDNYFQDYPTHANDDGEMIISGEDLSIEWQKITDAMNDINSEGRQYRPFDQNSNTAVDEALKRSGLPQPGGDGLSGYWSPGSGGFLDFDFDFDFDFPDPLGFFYRDPLLIDLNGDGIALTSAQSSTAYFDYGGDGFREKTGWVNPSDGILVRDLNSNGTIDNLTEMLASDRQDVIKTLQGLDTNADGKISAADSVWSSLRVWRDADGDGVTDAGELLTLSHAGVSEVNLNGTAQNTWDNDNTVASQHTVIVNGVAQIGKAVFFGTDLADAQFQVPEGFVRNTETILLPNLAGGGGVPPLYYSMSTNPALLAEVKALVLSSASMSWSALRVAVENMLYDWAATATSVGPVQFDDDVINPVVINQGHVVLLQQFSGTPFGSRVVSDGVYLRMETVYQEMLDKFTALFAAQSAVSTYMMALVGSIEAQAIDLQQHNWRFLNYLSVAPNGLSVSFDPVLIATKILDGVKSKFGVNQQINNLVFEDASIGNVLKALDVFLDESPIAFAEKCAITASSNTTLTSNDINRIAAIGYLMVGGTIANVVSGTGTLNGTGLLIGNEANDTLNGSASANLIAGGLGADSLSGKGGNDTYIYNNGDGVDTILENGVIEGTADKLTFTGHSFAELKVARSTTNDDLILTFTNNADQVIVKDGAVGLYDKGVEVFTFTGGVTETLAELKALSITQLQTTAADTIKGYANWADTFTGGLGNDTLTGLSGNDTYIYNNGDGVDTILENGVIEGTADKLTFTGHSFAELKVARSTTNDDLILTFTTNTDQVTIKDGAVGLYDKGVEVFTFTGGVTKTLAELKALSITQLQTTAANTIKGYANSADTFTGGLGNDTLTGLSGNDRFVYAAGFGKDIITDFTAGSAVNDVLQLTLGTSFDTYAELMAVAVQIGSNTVINITANDTITLNGVTKTNLVANDFEFI